MREIGTTDLQTLIFELKRLEASHGKLPVVVTVLHSPLRVERVVGAHYDPKDGPHDYEDCIKIDLGEQFN